MRIFKFLKYYKLFSNAEKRLQELKKISSLKRIKFEALSKNNRSDIAAAQRKKTEYYRGKEEAYTESLRIINSLINTGSVPVDMFDPE